MVGGLSGSLKFTLAEDAVFLLEGAPIVRGRNAVLSLLDAQAGLADVRLFWEPLRIVVSRDGLFGVTFGSCAVQRPQRLPLPSRYIAVWRREVGTWKMVALMQTGLLEGEALLPATTGVGAAPSLSDEFSVADLAFARMAGDSGAPAAFFKFGAPDVMTFAGTGELNIGPANVRSRLAEGRSASAAWSWHPVLSFSAASGDLGATIGEAVIRLGGDASYSKYLTVWQRQPDGSVKFIVDGGSSRPPQ